MSWIRRLAEVCWWLPFTVGFALGYRVARRPEPPRLELPRPGRRWPN